MKNTALLIVDLQNDYFPSFKEAKYPLENTEKIALNASKLLDTFRQKKMKIIHIKHESLKKDAKFFVRNTKGANIYKTLLPLKDEEVIIKHKINSFLDTNLKGVLDDSNIANVIIIGAMSHMCIDALVRAASDLEYQCFVAHDACTTRDLEFNSIKIKASFVHAAFMSSLEFAYAKVSTTSSLIKLIKE